MTSGRLGATAACLFAAVFANPRLVASQTQSLAGKTFTIIIGSGVGGGFDVWARVIARHMSRHLPGEPNVVVQNMPGAGGFVAANNIYNLAPKDGSTVAVLPGPAFLGTITGAAGALFDAAKFTWVGMPTTETYICIAVDRPQAKVRKAADLYDNELIVGTTGPGNMTYNWPKTFAALLGMKFRAVAGFPSTPSIFHAIEGGELDGVCQSLESIALRKPDWIASGKAVILMQGGAAPNPRLKEVPFVPDLANNAEDRTALEFLLAGEGLSRPFIAPPGMAPERAKMLQDAFMATMRDPEFVADAHKQQLEVDPRDGEYVAAFVKKVYATPMSVVEKIAGLVR